MTDRSCTTCKHLTASPSPCGDCVFHKGLPKWEARKVTPPGPTYMPPLTNVEREGVGLPPVLTVQEAQAYVAAVAAKNDAALDRRPAGLDGSGQENPKARYGRSKPQLGLLPAAALIEMAGAMELGAIKYGAANWREDPVESMTYAHAGLRHVLSWIDGEDIDPESGCSHLAHAMACFGIIIDAGHVGAMLDNRPLPGAAGRLIRERTKDVA